MKTLKGPAIFLAQFIGSEPPFNKLDTMAKWAAGLGYVGVQMPTGGADSVLRPGAGRREPGLLRRHRRAAGRTTACRSPSCRPTCRASWSPCTRPTTSCSTASPPPSVRGKPQERQAWAVSQVKAAAVASRRLGLTAHATFSGALAWPYFYPWPQRPAGLIEEAFAELGPPLEADPGRLRRRAASTSATRSTRARTCTTARPSSGSWTRSAATRAPTCSTTPATSCCSSWTTWTTSTAITSGSAPST